MNSWNISQYEANLQEVVFNRTIYQLSHFRHCSGFDLYALRHWPYSVAILKNTAKGDLWHINVMWYHMWNIQWRHYGNKDVLTICMYFIYVFLHSGTFNGQSYKSGGSPWPFSLCVWMMYCLLWGYIARRHSVFSLNNLIVFIIIL